MAHPQLAGWPHTHTMNVEKSNVEVTQEAYNVIALWSLI